MNFRLGKAFCILLSTLIPFLKSFAIDFDQDGYDDFILIDVNSSNRLEWFAIDLNDSARRALGQFGSVGDHLAVGDWAAGNKASKALIKRRNNGDLEWNIDGQKIILFGKHPDLIVSGLDADDNGVIDPTLASVAQRNLNWRVMYNPSLSGSPQIQEIKFGGKNDLPFYANIDGNGDRIATAKVTKSGALTMRFKNLVNGKVKIISVKNLGTKIYKILPVEQANGKDVLFVINKRGNKHRVTIVKGKKKIRVFTIKGDEFVVGRYSGANSDVFVARSSSSKALMIGATGRRSSVAIDLSGILVDDVNINTFDSSDLNKPSPPVNNPTPPPNTNPANPLCSGTQTSTEHLLYKPVSDTNGNVVLVFDSKYSREFLAVRIELRDGTYAEGWWKGLELWGNPDAGGPRQHWRTNVRASQVKDGALIIADDLGQECRFVIPGSSNKRWE